jgi:hypothetical protein
VLSGATQSRTTKDQWLVGLVLSFLVAALSLVVPGLQDDAAAVGAVLALLAVVGPMISRMALFKEPPDEEVLDIPDDALVVSNDLLARKIVRVRDGISGSWSRFDGTWKEALLSGWNQGALEDGEVVFLVTGEEAGVSLRLKEEAKDGAGLLRAAEVLFLAEKKRREEEENHD